MASGATDINESKERLDEIVASVQAEGVSTDEILDYLEEAVNIGMDVCKQVQTSANGASLQE